jgi:mono/diheme cytochrome c family protein
VRKDSRIWSGRRQWLAVTAAFVAVLAGPGCRSLPPSPPDATTPAESEGRHVLQTAAACGCHGANFAGWKEGRPNDFPRAAPYGERFVGPFGAVPAANITPDKETGIGSWTDEQIKRAITDGVDPGGRKLAPLMPYAVYHGMAASDLDALVAYLHRLRPVHNEVTGWEFKGQMPEPAPPQTPPEGGRPAGGVELGRYLVHSVSGCTDCHAPGGPGPDAEKLIGKVLHIGGAAIVAPNLTPDRATGLGAWSEGDIARYLRTGTRPDGGLAQSAMAGLILTSFSHYSPDEARAVAAYLKNLPAVHHRPE